MNKRIITSLALITLLVILLAACGHSTEDAFSKTASLTTSVAAEWTSTPAVTQTPLATPTTNSTLTATYLPVPTIIPSVTPIPTLTLTPITIISRIWEKDGMEQVFVPAGDFSMGHQAFTDYFRLVYLDSYWIDKTEITNAMFTRFISETHYWTDAEKNGKGRIIENGVYKDIYGANWEHPQGPASDLQNKEHWPVTQVSWNDATAYCKWAGKRLPTDAEWEKAARGTNSQAYPWGNEAPSCRLANTNKGSFIYCVGEATQVGSYPDGISPYGALDMFGNVWEWVYDWDDPEAALLKQYKQTISPPIDNPTGPQTGLYKILRGGGWELDGYYKFVPPELYANTYGFRCVSSVDE